MQVIGMWESVQTKLEIAEAHAEMEGERGKDGE